MSTDRQTTVEHVARALWRLDNPEDDGFSEVAPNDWDRWPEHGRDASLAYVDHSKDDYREQARAALGAIDAAGLTIVPKSWLVKGTAWKANQSTEDVCGICDGNGCPDCAELPDYDPIVLRAFATDTARVLRAAAAEIERLRCQNHKPLKGG